MFETDLILVPRDEWRGLPPRKTEQMTHPITKVVITYDTGIPLCGNKQECIRAIRILQKRHMESDHSDDIKYNFLVGGDGIVYEGRGFHAQPCKSIDYPELHTGDRLDIAFIGQFPGRLAVTPSQLFAAYETAQKGVQEGIVDKSYDLHEIPRQNLTENENGEQTQTTKKIFHFTNEKTG